MSHLFDRPLEVCPSMETPLRRAFFGAVGAAVVLFAPNLTAQSAPSASIQGLVASSDSKTPLPQTYVTAVKKGLPPASQYALVASDGTFKISGLRAGIYDLCLDAPGFLDPCQWDLPVTTVSIRDGQAFTANTLSIRPGTVIKLHLQDSSGLLSKPTSDGRTPSVVAAIWSGGGGKLVSTTASVSASGVPTLPKFHTLHQVAQTATAADYELPVPPDTPLRFYIGSHDLVIGDSAGVALANNESSPQFQQASNGSTATAFTYSVVGAR